VSVIFATLFADIYFVAAEDILIVPAEFKNSSGNFVAQDSRWSNLGVYNGNKGFVTWSFNVKNAGKYQFQALYASDGNRPCTFQLNSPDKTKKEFKSVFANSTGGFFAENLKWEELPECLDLASGDYSFTLTFDQCLPHFAGFRITTNNTTPDSNTNAFLEKFKEQKRLAELKEKELNEKITAKAREKLQKIVPDAESILFIRRPTFQSSHYYTDFIDGSVFFGSELCLLSIKDGSIKSLAPTLKDGIIGRCNLSFDGKKIIFDYKRKLGEGYRIWEINIDGSGLRQLTFPPTDENERMAKYRMDKNNIVSNRWERYKGIGANRYFHHTDDFHPAYLPDGGFVFVSTRCEHGILCDGPDVLTASVVYRADKNGNIEKLSDNSVSESCPTIMEDGRILYTRWEYVDNGSVTNKGLWALNPDGTASTEIYGIDIVFPAVFNTARQIPGQPTKFVCIGAPHMPVGLGTILLVDTRFDRRTVEGVKYITPEVDQQYQWGWTKPVNGQFFTRLYEPPAVKSVSIQRDYSRDGGGNTDKGPLFIDPFPFNEHDFLVSYNPDKKWNTVNAYGLYLINDAGERDLLFKDSEWSAWCPIPVRATVNPPTPVAALDSNLAEKKLAQLIVTDVYAGMEGVPRGSIKYLRINEHVPRPWSARRYWDGDEFDQQHSVISHNAALGLRVQHGVVPVEKDGSANFVVPADKNIFLQALDENYREVQRERTFVNYRPGEVRSCIGCHEQASAAPTDKKSMPLALRGAYNLPGPQLGEKSGSRPISYYEDVQPVLDRHCVRCHNSEKKDGDVNLEGKLTRLFNVSYETLMKRDSFPIIGENHPKAGNNHYLPPYSLGSNASKLVKLLDKGHYDIKMPMEDWIRLTTWIDSNGQYYGTYFGRKNLQYKDFPDFRPKPTFEETQTAIPPIPFHQPNAKK
ncbi:MAG: hypothetical protein LBB88_10155, partial [Planctomycetaceae bacterium]|nr:hypothetical protein [Planctomycetaceae bacterium]